MLNMLKICVCQFLTKLHPFFTYEGGLPSVYNRDVSSWRGMRNGMAPECPVSVEGGPSLNSSERRDGTVNFESGVDFNLNFSDNVCIELPTRDMLWNLFVPTYLSATSATYISYIFWLPIALWQYLTMNIEHWTQPNVCFENKQMVAFQIFLGQEPHWEWHSGNLALFDANHFCPFKDKNWN